MESQELALLKKIRLQPSRKLNTLFMGEYHSAFKGHGLSFDAVREYQYGDDVRSIDWNVSARMRHLFVKEYIEERELSVVLMIDMSGSTEFGSGQRKRDLILEVAALFLNLAQINNDRVSVCLFTDRIERFIRPKKGRKFILKVLDEILKCRPASRKTDISGAIDFIQRVLKKRSIVFIISDFLDPDDSFILKMKLLARKHDIIPVQVSDPLEKEVALFRPHRVRRSRNRQGLSLRRDPGKGQLPGARRVQRHIPEHRGIDRDPHPEILREAEPDQDDEVMT